MHEKFLDSMKKDAFRQNRLVFRNENHVCRPSARPDNVPGIFPRVFRLAVIMPKDSFCTRRGFECLFWRAPGIAKCRSTARRPYRGKSTQAKSLVSPEDERKVERLPRRHRREILIKVDPRSRGVIERMIYSEPKGPPSFPERV